MNRFTRMALVAVLAGGLAAAAPGFSFTTDAKMNAMMSNDAIGLSAYPKLKLLARSVQGSRATLVYAGEDAAGAFAFYDKAFKAEGWKEAHAMMAGSDKAAGGAMAGAMMKDGSYAGRYEMKAYSLGLSSRAASGKTHVDFSVK